MSFQTSVTALAFTDTPATLIWECAALTHFVVGNPKQKNVSLFVSLVNKHASMLCEAAHAYRDNANMLMLNRYVHHISLKSNNANICCKGTAMEISLGLIVISLITFDMLCLINILDNECQWTKQMNMKHKASEGEGNVISFAQPLDYQTFWPCDGARGKVQSHLAILHKYNKYLCKTLTIKYLFQVIQCVTIVTSVETSDCVTGGKSI